MLHLGAKHAGARHCESEAEQAAFPPLAVANYGHVDRRTAAWGRSESIVPAAARAPGVRVEGLDRHCVRGQIPRVSLTLPDTTGNRVSFGHLGPARSLTVQLEVGTVDIWPNLRTAWAEVGEGRKHSFWRERGMQLEMDRHDSSALRLIG